MPGLASIADLRLVAEDDDLLAAPMLDHLGTHYGARHGWGANTRRAIAVAGHEQDAAQLELFARLTAEPLDGDRIARFDAVLLPACFDNGVHRSAQFSDPR